MQTRYKPIKFPRDESAHNYGIEWWYFNGNLKDKKGNRYAFMDCLFRVNVKKLGVPLINKIIPGDFYFYFAHSIISDVKNKKNHLNIKPAVLLSKDSFKKPQLYINYTNPLLINGFDSYVIEKTDLLTYHIENENLDLKLKTVKNPMLEKGIGFTDNLGEKSFYYSITNFEASGMVKINKKEIEVKGKAWMDHQWTNSAGYYSDKWHWFSIQLENNTEIMCNEYISGAQKSYLAEIMYSNGKHESLNELKLVPSWIWTSRKTKEKYPLRWKIEIPERKIILEISASVKNQEVIAGAANYWEGPIDVKGKFNGKKIKGAGFMELVGNASPYGKYSIDEIIKSIEKLFKIYADNPSRKS